MADAYALANEDNELLNVKHAYSRISMNASPPAVAKFVDSHRGFRAIYNALTMVVKEFSRDILTNPPASLVAPRLRISNTICRFAVIGLAIAVQPSALNCLQ